MKTDETVDIWGGGGCMHKKTCVYMHARIYIYLEHPSLPKFLPLAQTYCKTRGRHQNMVNVHFFLLRAFFPKPGWSVLQDDL